MQSDDALEGVRYVPLAGLEIEDARKPYQGGERLSGEGTPADLFMGEHQKWQPPADLDHFFQRVYHYYCDKGFWCIVTQWVVELLTLGFTIGFSSFLLLVIDWSGLLSARCGVAAAEEGHPPCNLAEEAINKHPLQPFTFSRAMVMGYLVVFSLYWLFCFVRFFTQLRDLLEIRDFCHNSLGITEHELQTMTWPALVDRMVAFQKQHRLCVVKDLTAHDIISRIMRKENYLVGMLNKGVLAMRVPSWLPGAGPASGGEVTEPGQRLLLTKTVEWSLQWCILHYMFDQNFLIRRDFASNPEVLRKRLRAVGLFMLILSPFLSIFMLVYFFLRNAEQFYHQPSTAGSRRWSNVAKWKFREFNELEHFLQQRLNASYFHAMEYGKQFPSPIVSMVAKFVSFVTGAFAAVLLGIALMDESLLEAQVWGRNLFWYAAIIGTILAVSRSLITEEYSVFDPEGCMQRIVQHTHYLPKHWRGAANVDLVRAEFEALFQLKAVLFLEEMVSIFVTPFLLWFCLPQNVDKILQFVQDFTMHVEGVGHVCSLSVFDFQQHGNPKYGSPFEASKDRRSSQGKMEKSFVGFKSHYPNWEPSATGKEFLSRLAEFQSQQGEGLAAGNPALTTSRFSVPSQQHSSAPHSQSAPYLWPGMPGMPLGMPTFASGPALSRPIASHAASSPRLSTEMPGGMSPKGALGGHAFSPRATSGFADATRYSESSLDRAGRHLLMPGGRQVGPGEGMAASGNMGRSGEGSESLVNYEQVNQLFWLDKFYMSSSARSASSGMPSEEGMVGWRGRDSGGIPMGRPGVTSSGEAEGVRGDWTEAQTGGSGSRDQNWMGSGMEASERLRDWTRTDSESAYERHSQLEHSLEGVGYGETLQGNLRGSVGTEADFGVAEIIFPGAGSRHRHEGSGRAQRDFVIPFRESVRPFVDGKLGNEGDASDLLPSMHTRMFTHPGEGESSEDDGERDWVTRRMSSRQQDGEWNGSDSASRAMLGLRRGASGAGVSASGFGRGRLSGMENSGEDGKEMPGSPPLPFGDVYRRPADGDGEQIHWLRRTEPS